MAIDTYMHIRAAGKAAKVPTIAEIGLLSYEGKRVHQSLSMMIKPTEGDIVPPLWSTVTHAGCQKYGLPLHYVMPVVAKIIRTSDHLYAFDLTEQMALLELMHKLANYEFNIPYDRRSLHPENTTMFMHMAAVGVCGVLRKHHLSITVDDLTENGETYRRRRNTGDNGAGGHV